MVRLKLATVCLFKTRLTVLGHFKKEDNLSRHQFFLLVDFFFTFAEAATRGVL